MTRPYCPSCEDLPVCVHLPKMMLNDNSQSAPELRLTWRGNVLAAAEKRILHQEVRATEEESRRS